MTVTEAVDIRQLLADTASLTHKSIARLQDAINRNASEVRQYCSDLLRRVEAGEDGPDLLRTCGLIAYFLADSQTADRCLSRIDGDGLAAYYHAKALAAMERYEKAAERFLAAEQFGWDPVDCELQRAGAIRLSGRLDEAEELIRGTGTAGATRAEYSYQMGCLLADRCDSFGALEYFERAADMDPRHSGALFRLGVLNGIFGEDHEAIELYERCLSKPPYFLGALINLGVLYEDIGNQSAAVFCFRRVLEANPNHERARLYLKDIEASAEGVVDDSEVRRHREIQQLLERSINDFELSARSRNCLERAGIETLDDLTRTTEQALLATKHFGETSLAEVREALDSVGLKIGQFVTTSRPVVPDYSVTNLSPEERKLLETSVSDLNLSVRARKCLNRLNIATVGELVIKSADELLSVRNFGVTSLNEIRAKLTELGTSLRND